MKQCLSVLIAINTLIFASNAFACSVPDSTSDDIRTLVTEHGGWPISDSRCALLKEKGLRLAVSADATVLAGSSVGWAVVSLADNNNIKSYHLQTSTYVNSSTASMDVAKTLAYNAIRDAIKGLDFELASKQVITSQKAAKGR